MRTQQRRAIIVLAGLLVAAMWLRADAAFPMQTPPTPAGAGSYFSWLFDDADATANNLTKFQGRIDNAATPVDLPVTGGPLVVSVPTAGSHEYRWLFPLLSTGVAHTFDVRACNDVECSPWTAPITFKLVAAPAKPTGVKIVNKS